MKSHLEEKFELFINSSGLPKPIREYRFSPPRKFRFDFAWPEEKVAVEIEGGTWIGGGHNRGVIYASNCEKYNLAVLHGWKVLRFTGNMINLEAVEAVKLLLNIHKEE